MAAGEVTRGDIDRIHQRFDQMATCQTEQAIALARIEERVAQIKPVVLPPRPCEYIQKHQDAHAVAEAEEKKGWKNLAIRLAAPALAGAGIGGGIVSAVLALVK
jgi:hypothetical protein